MSLKNISLPGSVIADLYRQTLVQDETWAPIEAVETVNAAAAQPVVEQPIPKPVKTPATKPVAAQQPVEKTQTTKPVSAQQPEEKTPAIKPQPAQQPAEQTPITQQAAEQTPATQHTAYKALGNNKKNISVIVHFPSEVFVPEAELQFLTKMLGACKLNLADVAIVNHSTSAVEIEKLKIQLQPRYVLLFGVEPTEILLPINFPSFKEQPYAGTTYLFSPGLSQLNQETDAAKQAKRKLWDCLKRMFV